MTRTRPAHRIAAGIAVSLAACSPEPAPIAAHTLDAAALQPLLDRLDRLTAAMEAHAPGPSAAHGAATFVDAGAPGGAETARVAAGEPELLRRLEAIEAELARLQAAARAPAWRYPHQSAPPKNTAAIGPLLQQAHGDERAQAAARATLFGLGEEQVLQRLGVPDWASADGNSVQWCYRDGKGDGVRELYVTFANGRVIAVN